MRMILTAVSAAGLASCASQATLHELNAKPAPPKSALIADIYSPLADNVALLDVRGVPHFTLFDQLSIVTTKPTERDVERAFSAYLGQIGLKAPTLYDAEYLLTVDFNDIKGPSLVPFTDKKAHATTTFTLVSATTGQTIYTGTHDANFVARMPGVTPDMIRGGLFGAAAGATVATILINDTPNEGEFITWGALTGATTAGVSNQVANGWGPDYQPPIAGGAIGALAGHLGLQWIEELADNTHTLHVSNLEAGAYGALVGAITGAIGAGPKGVAPTSPFAIGAVGSFGEQERREQAVSALLRQSFAYFAADLAVQGLGVDRVAVVPCAQLNPHGTRDIVFLGNGKQVVRGCD